MHCHSQRTSPAPGLPVHENLALLHFQQSDLQAALQLVDEVLQARIKALGAEHCTTVRTKELIKSLSERHAQADSAQNNNTANQDTIKFAVEEILHDSHMHPLRKAADPYVHGYICDICDEGGCGWVYHCVECGYDAHPWCVGAVEKPELAMDL